MWDGLTGLARRSGRALAALLLAGAIAGCGGGGGGGGADPVAPAPPVATLDAARTATVTLGRDGGTLSASAADGTSYELTVPAGALAAPIEITMTPVTRVAGLPLSGGMVGAVRLQPSGLQFARPAWLRITAPSITAPAGQSLAGFKFAAGDAAVQRSVALAGDDAVRVAVPHFSVHGAGFGTVPDIRSMGPGADRTPAEGQAFAEVLDILLVAGTNADEKYDAYLRYYDEVVEPQIRRAQTAAELQRAVAEFAGWASDFYNGLVSPSPTLSATWDPWYLPVVGTDGPEFDAEILARSQAWGELAAPKLHQAFLDNNALCAEEQSLAAQQCGPLLRPGRLVALGRRAAVRRHRRRGGSA